MNEWKKGNLRENMSTGRDRGNEEYRKKERWSYEKRKAEGRNEGNK